MIVKLKHLIKDLDVIVKGSKEVRIGGITDNSRAVGPGYLFFAKKGREFDGNLFISDAIRGGARCVVTDLYNPFLDNIVQIITSDVKKIEREIALKFYKNPAHALFMVGVTGTSGKTTTTYLIRHLLEKKCKTGLIGTIETIIQDDVKKNVLTTPDFLESQKILYEMNLRRIEVCIMEVSSHGLDQGRVEGIEFNQAIFTNLSHDHLDYHGDMESYFQTKKRLFTDHLKKEGLSIIHTGSIEGRELAKQVKGRKVTVAVEREETFSAWQIRTFFDRTEFVLKTPQGKWDITMPLIGRYNVENVVCAIASAVDYGIRMEDIQERLMSFPPVKGRLELVSALDEKYIYVDYAHKPGALENVLKTLIPLKKGKLILIFGCGGNRDRLKRPIMAALGEKYADLVIVTSDNPRNENPEEIIQEIKRGFVQTNYLVESDRRLAIEKGIFLMEKGDILLIAGKGHETKQIFQGKTVFFDDAKVAKEFLNVLT